MKNKQLKRKGKLKKIIKSDPKLGNVYNKHDREVVRQRMDNEPAYDTRSTRDEDDDDSGLSVIGAIATAEIIEDIVETVVDNTPDVDYGGGDTGGGGAGGDY